MTERVTVGFMKDISYIDVCGELCFVCVSTLIIL